MAMHWRVFRSILRSVEGSPDIHPGDVVKGESSLPTPACTEVGLHVGEARGGVLHIKGQLGGGRSSAPLHIILEGLLVRKVLDVIPSPLGPFVNATGGAPHVLRVEQKQLKLAHGELGDAIALDVVAGLPDGTAHLPNHVVVNLAEGLDALNRLVVVECGGCPPREKEHAHKHHDCVVPLLELERNFRGRRVISVFLFLAVIGLFIRVLTAVTPCLAPALESIPLSTREVLLTGSLASGVFPNTAWSSPGHCVLVGQSRQSGTQGCQVCVVVAVTSAWSLRRRVQSS